MEGTAVLRTWCLDVEILSTDSGAFPSDRVCTWHLLDYRIKLTNNMVKGCFMDKQVLHLSAGKWSSYHFLKLGR